MCENSDHSRPGLWPALWIKKTVVRKAVGSGEWSLFSWGYFHPLEFFEYVQ